MNALGIDDAYVIEGPPNSYPPPDWYGFCANVNIHYGCLDDCEECCRIARSSSIDLTKCPICRSPLLRTDGPHYAECTCGAHLTTCIGLLSGGLEGGCQIVTGIAITDITSKYEDAI